MMRTGALRGSGTGTQWLEESSHGLAAKSSNGTTWGWAASMEDLKGQTDKILFAFTPGPGLGPHLVITFTYFKIEGHCWICDSKVSCQILKPTTELILATRSPPFYCMN